MPGWNFGRPRRVLLTSCKICVPCCIILVSPITQYIASIPPPSSPTASWPPHHWPPALSAGPQHPLACNTPRSWASPRLSQPPPTSYSLRLPRASESSRCTCIAGTCLTNPVSSMRDTLYKTSFIKAEPIGRTPRDWVASHS